MLRLIIHRVFRLVFAFIILFICNNSFAQDDVLKRQVQGREMKFRNSSSYDTFKTAQDACIQWGQVTLPQGYTYHSYNMNENGGCQCIFKKPGSADNDQGGQVWAIIVCPENASTYNKGQGNNINDVVCVCNTGYKPNGSKCELDTCGQYENMGEEALKSWAQAKLQKFCDEENEAFKNDPAGAMHPQNAPPILTDGEKMQWLSWGSKIAANGNQTYSDKVWNMVYGHAIERLVARRVEKDKCLKEYLTYVKNSSQMKEEGTNPDFKGKGKLPATNEFDITTAEQVMVKMNDPKKAHFIFITYTRLFTSDDLAAAEPLPEQGTPKPPKGNTPPPKTITPKIQKPNTPKTNTPKPPKSSTDGR